MAGIASNQLRSSFVMEVTPGTTPATPAFKTLHSPALFTGETERFHQNPLTAGGARSGDTLLTNPALGKISGPLVYSIYDPLLETLFQSTFVTNVMLDGKARTTASFENSIPAGIGGPLSHMRHRGVEAVGGQFTVDARGAVNFSLDLVGMASADSTTTAIVGATYTDPGNKDPFSSNTDIGAITLAGFPLDGIASLTMDFNYERREIQPVLGSDILAGIGRGAFMPVIKLKCFLDTNFAAIYNLARASTQAGAKFTVNIGSVTLKKYRYEFWNCTVDMAPVSLTDANGFYEITVMPGYSTANGCVMTLTRDLV